MRKFLYVTLAGLFALNTQTLLCEERTNPMVSIPTGKLAFVTSDSFGKAGGIDIMTGRNRTSTGSFRARQPEFLPDGERIIYGAGYDKTGVFIYDLKNESNTQLLTDIPKAEDPSLSPDGNQIAFIQYTEGRKSSHIYTANLDGSNLKQLTDGDQYDWTPRWSPDGKHLVFETTRNDDRNIYVMDSDGKNQTNLTVGVFGHHPAWSPDGKFIAYMGRPGGVWVMNADGSDKRNISHAKTRDSEPAWSPDGQWIAFTRTANKPPGPETMDIWLMKSDGTEQRQITFNEGESACYGPSWSK